jgi:hypothetical protein
LFLKEDLKKVADTKQKRSIDDVEKMIIEDEFMSFLICDMCVNENCQSSYCQACQSCQIHNMKNGLYSILKSITSLKTKLEKTLYTFENQLTHLDKIKTTDTPIDPEIAAALDQM